MALALASSTLAGQDQALDAASPRAEGHSDHDDYAGPIANDKVGPHGRLIFMRHVDPASLFE